MAQRRRLKPRNNDVLLDQGEVLSDVPLVTWKDGEAKVRPNRAVITSHGCVCEEYERAVEAKRSGAASRAYIQVAPLRSASVFKDKIDLIREGRMCDYFYVEGDGQQLTHQVAVLVQEQAIPAETLADCKRSAQLADWQWEALRLHLTLARFRMKPEELFRDEFLTKEVSDGA